VNYSNSQRAGVILYLTALLFGGYEIKLNGTIRVQLDFVGHIDPSVKAGMIRELKEFVKKYYL